MNAKQSTEPFKPGRLGQAVALACLLGASAAAHAGGTISLGDDKSISLGLGLKTSYTSTEKGAPDGSRSSDFNVDSARLYVNASLSKMIKLTFNTEKSSDDNVKVLDAFGSLQFMPEFNFDMGRTIIPSDRANLSGGYYLPAWDFAGVGSTAYSKFASRDDGAVVWGKLMGSKLVYSFGAFQGRNHDHTTPTAGYSNTSDSPLLAGRLAFNFWSPEPAPAYLTGSTYYGSADILTLGVWGHSQKNGVGSATTRDDYSAWGTDLLLEKKLAGAGVITVEGGYTKTDWSAAAATADDTIHGGTGTGIGSAGKAYIGSLAYLIPAQVGWGKFQPFYRYQKFDRDAGATTKRNDFGVNYVIDGSNARLTATYRTDKTDGSESINGFILGMQLQY
jgi:hypothetical protein